MESIIESSIIGNSSEYSSFEIEESINVDADESVSLTCPNGQSDIHNGSSEAKDFEVDTTKRRSVLENDSSDSDSTSDAIVLSSDDEESCDTNTSSTQDVAENNQIKIRPTPLAKMQGRISSTDPKNDATDPKSDSTDTSNDTTNTSNDTTDTSNDATDTSNDATDTSNDATDPTSDDNAKYKEVTQLEYDRHVSKIGEISAKITQYESLLKLSSQLPDRGTKLKHLLVNHKAELTDMQNTLQHLSIKEPVDLVLDFQNMSLNTNESSVAERSLDSTEESIVVGSRGLIAKLKSSENTMPSKTDLADQPRLITGNLMPHQRHALAWMSWREKQFPYGGILADDMGLGKTLTIISLIAQDVEQRGSSQEHIKNRKPKQQGDEKVRKGRTLIICPASLIKQWEDEINKFTNYALRICLHHGDRRSDSAKELTLHEVVITTYGIVRAEVEKFGVLSEIHWDRIVLDEAHTIRNHTSKQSLCCCRLKGSTKWALTGTPIQNKHGDIFALLKFLQCNPLDEIRHWKHFTSSKAADKIAYLMKFLLLRRTKVELGKMGEMNSLPEKQFQNIRVTLMDDEMKLYETVSSFSKALSKEFLRGRDSSQNATKINRLDEENVQKALEFFAINGIISSSHILLVILRLRQICIHPSLIDAMLMEEDIRDISSHANLLEELNELTISAKNDNQKLHRSNPVFDPDRISSKFESVLSTIQVKVIDRGEKAVVVSQFTSVLKLLENNLSTKGIKYLVLTGSTNVSHRQQIVETFNEDSEEQILLLSLTAGGTGLNLCGANHLFFIDPHWNPQLESQAEDRIYRIGQTKPVTIYRFICEGTIEERIEKLQEQKKGVANNILSGFKINLNEMMNLI